MAVRATSLSVRVGEAFSFADPELLALPDGRLEALAREAPALSAYAHALDDVVRNKPYTRPEGEERLLAIAADFGATPSTVFGMFNNADLRFGVVTDDEGRDVELTHARYAALQRSPKREVRESAWRTLLGAYRRYENTLAANLAGGVKRHLFVARARGYPSCLAAALGRNNVPTEVYRSLVSTVSGAIAPLHRYMEMRRRVLGVERFEAWDLGAPLLPETARRIPFDEAVTTVREGLVPLGGEYLAAYDEGIAGGWIDVYESQGKRSGAYSWGGYSTKPYLLLNYNDTRDDLFTLAHEMGHSIHSLFTRRAQPYVYGHYAIFVAEVASTMNEALLVERLLARAESAEQEASLLNHYLDQIRGTFFVQTMFADFELRIHEMAEAGEALTAASLGALFRETYARYHGPALALDPLLSIGWARIPHFYYDFYVFQYATSYAAATALAARVLADGESIVARYLDLLRAGGSDYPVALLARAGVDLTTPGPVLDTIARFSALLDRLEALLPSHRPPAGVPAA
jgi:oligoendopeptidase F